MTVHLPPEPPSWVQAPPQQVYQRAAWPAVPVHRDRGPGPHDTVLASALLGINFVIAAVGSAGGVLLQWVLEAYYERLGEGYFRSGSVASAQIDLVVSHTVLFVASAVLTLFLMRRKRRSFYVPLIASLITILGFWLILMPVLYSDHSLGSIA